MIRRFALFVGIACGGPTALAAQHAVTSDLWRVAAGTLAVPAPLADGASALLWTPVVVLDSGEATARLGITSIHAPEDVGANGGTASVSARFHRTTLSVAWGRIGIGGIARTETSPEAVDGTVPVEAQVVVAGIARALTPWLQAGVSLRLANGQLGDVSRSRGGVDVGAVAVVSRQLRVGAATRAFDPSLEGTDAASYGVAAEVRSTPFAALGTEGDVRVRYGVTLQRGEGAAHFVTAGIALGAGLTVDAGAVRESAAGLGTWRSRVGVSVGARRYRVEFGRDGGLNGFGATYAFGLTASVR